MRKRRHSSHTAILEAHLERARRLPDKAEHPPPNADLEHSLRGSTETEAAAEIDKWLNSPGLRRPT
jgi:hypothetical protein